MAAGQVPQAVIGDLDSLSARARAELADRLHPVPEQETTDFDKALRHIAAPFVLAVGFSGARMDHGLAVLNTLVRHPDRRCLVLSGKDVCFLAPPRITLTMRPRARLSLFPMAPVSGRSEGLRWPIDGLCFSPAGIVGTSNEATAGQVSLSFDAPGMLVILPRAGLRSAIESLTSAPVWPNARPDARGG
ncbi:MAG: thiamine pyrophosphokinase [Paracoccaceae bacterium]|nr:thiamine pyrophosphokinase [Paracoccaceae bacterium]